MNISDTSGRTAPGEEDDRMPDLSEARIDDIEHDLFADIARDRAASHARRTRRGRWWLGGAAAAAIVVVAAVIAPGVGSLVGSTGVNESAVAPASPLSGPATDGTELAPQQRLDDSGAAGGAADGAVPTGEREVITTASATVRVADGSEAAGVATAIGDAAEASGGYVESLSVGRSGQTEPVDPANGGVVYDSMPSSPFHPDGAWITVRVPADQLAPLMDGLSELGEVTASTVDRQDVTDQAIDLRARADAARASVARMTELLAQAGSLTDLIAAESALAERQATLESYEQQLEYLDTQVALSTLTVSLTVSPDAVEADPAGFADGLAAGWNGLVATLNGIVIALGFLLPWLVVLAVAGLVVWCVAAIARRSRRRRDEPVGPVDPS